MPTLTQYRQRVARDLGQFETGTATSGSTTGVLEATAWPFRSTMDVGSTYEQWHLYRPAAAAAADRVRYVKSWDPTTGQFTPDLAWSAAPYADATGEAFELHGLIEPATALRDLINRALERCFVVVEFTITPSNVTDREHSLSTQAWLTNPEWVRQVGYLGPSEDRGQVDPFTRTVRGEVVTRGTGVWYLAVGAYQPTTTLYVRAIKPAYAHCMGSGIGVHIYGDQSGLTLEADQALPSVEWVAAGVLVEAWMRYGHILEASANQRILLDAQKAAALFTAYTRQNFRLPQSTLRPVEHWG